MFVSPKIFLKCFKSWVPGLHATLLCCVMQIFTEDMDEVRILPRENVLNFIEKADETLVVPYLVSYF